MSNRLNPNINFLDKSFQGDRAAIYLLSLLLSSDRLSYTIFNPESNKFIGLGSIPLHQTDEKPADIALKELADATPLLRHPFKKVMIAYSGLQNTLVPNALFDESKTDTYFTFNHALSKESVISFDKLNHTAAVNIYSIREELRKVLNEIWPGSRLFHLSTVLIESLGINFKHLTNNKMLFVNVRENSFDIVYYKNSKLEFYNNFIYKTKEDFIYFLLATIEQLGLNPETAEIILSGAIEKEYQLYDMIFRYIRKFRFIESNSTFDYAHVMDEVKYHQYYGLYNIIQCES